MYNLLIADDERLIRDGLTNYIDYAQYGVECVGTASDGLQALERVRRGDVDILLTDISMPGMDGIALLKAAAQAHPGIKSIVLSGYDNFDYVREAMRAGAYTYLLKPVKRQELTEAVRAVVDQIDREAVDKRFHRESLRLMRMNMINRLLTNDINAAEVTDKLRLLEIPVPQSAAYRVAIIKLALDREIDPGQGDSRLFDAQAVVERAEAKLGPMASVDTLGNAVMLIPEAEYAQKLPALEALGTALEQTLSGRVGVVVGKPVQGLMAVSESYRSALSMLDYVYVMGTGHVIDQETYSALMRDAASAAPFDGTELRRLAQARDAEALRAQLDAYFDALQREPADIRQVRVNLIEFVSALSEELSLSSATSDNLYAARHRVLRALMQASFASDLRRVMFDGLDALLAGGETKKPDPSGRFTNEVIGIVEREYADVGLSIKSIAAQIHVNAAYLGRLFYKDTGRYFSDYLNEFRIRKAKELLLKPDARIQEIGEQVGYVSSSYFAQVFRQQTGVSPSKWRK